MVVLVMSPIEITQGGWLARDFELYDKDGAAVPMSGKLLYLNMKGVDTDTIGTEYVRNSGTATHQTWRTEASGLGTWIWRPDQSFTAGQYDVEVWLDDTSDATKPVLVGTTWARVYPAKTTVP